MLTKGGAAEGSLEQGAKQAGAKTKSVGDGVKSVANDSAAAAQGEPIPTLLQGFTLLLVEILGGADPTLQHTAAAALNA